MIYILLFFIITFIFGFIIDKIADNKCKGTYFYNEEDD